MKLENIGTFRYTISTSREDNEEEASEELIRDVKVRFTPNRTVIAVGKQRIVYRALIADNLTWEIYDKPSRNKPATMGGNGSTPPTPDPGSDENEG